MPNLFHPPIFSQWRDDFTAAIAGVLVSVPQSMAYGIILGGVMGNAWGGVGVLSALYGSVLVGLLTALFGGCPMMVTGPRASTSLVLATLVGQLLRSRALTGLVDPAPTALALASVAVCLAGMMQIVFAVLRLGRLSRFIPYPVITGFLNGSALLILASLVWSATGVPKQSSVAALLWHLDEIRPATLALSLTTAAVILAAPRLFKRAPAPLVGLVSGCLGYYGLAALGFGPAAGSTVPPLPDHGAVRLVIGQVGGLLAGSDAAELWTLLLPAALSIAALATLDTLLSASAIDALTLRRSNGTRELLALGLANAVAGLFTMMPGSGGMARTMAVLKGGGRTAAAVLLTALLTLAVTIVLAPLISYLPQAVMAGLLLTVGLGLVDAWPLDLARRLIRTRGGQAAARFDLFEVLVVVAAAVLINLPAAVAVGALVSLLSFASRMARTPIRRCYRASGLAARLSGDTERQVFLRHHGHRIAVIEIEGALFFGTVSEVEARVDELIAEGVSHLVLDLKRVSSIDTTGARALERLNAKLARVDGFLALGYLEQERRSRRGDGFGDDDRRRQSNSRRLWLELDLPGTLAKLGSDRLLPDIDQAVAVCERHLAQTLATQADEVPAAGTMPILHGIGRDGLRQLRPYVTRHVFRTGETIFHQGAAPDSVYLIALGRADVVIDLPRTDRKLRVQTLVPGTVFGEMAVIDPKPRSANIVATAPTRCWRLAAEDWHRLQVEQPDLAFRLIGNVAMIFAERLRAANTLLVELEA
ncbi:MAG TPA: SLC26A/SulP transporter family protein [Rhodospirillaceae bacterium]|nr:SLC26A/SulP transporter family protein [Rhodospirillaceae bacterium]